MSFRPTPRDIREDRQNGDLVIVLPKKKRIVPEQEEAEPNHREARRERADQVFARICHPERSEGPHKLLRVLSAQATPTMTCEIVRFAHDDKLSVVRQSALGSQSTTGRPSVMTSTLSSTPCLRALERRRSGGSSIGS
jgi:hypothetical protein